MHHIRAHASALALVAVTAVWGWTFVVVRDAIHDYPVLPFLALRFSIAALCLTPAVMRTRKNIGAGIVPGVALSCGYLAQTAGLEYTTASKAGLLTGLFVVLTPVLGMAVWRRMPGLTTLVAVIAALAGTVLLVLSGSAGGGGEEALGDGLEVATALAFSAHILLLAWLAVGKNAARLAWMQMVVAASLFALAAGILGQFRTPSASVWFAILLTGVLASALAFWVQTAAQKRISASRTAVILAAEPAFATLFGVVLAGDRFGLLQALGALLILGAIGFHEWAAGPPDFPVQAGSGPDPRGEGTGTE